MKCYRFFPFLVLTSMTLLIAAAILAQQAPQRDAQAVYMVAQSVSAMGGIVPPSSLAVGAMDLVEGSSQETARIRTVTRGLEESREEFQTSQGLRGAVYSRGFAAELSNTGLKPTSMEFAASSQSPCFPLILLASALNNPDFTFEYLGQESLDGSPVHHIRFWNTYRSDSRLQHLADFSVKELWIDAFSGLPRKLAYDQREAAGAAPSIRIEAYYSDYRNVGGVLYPFLIRRSYNGTPWATIRIENVTLGIALSDSDFQVR